MRELVTEEDLARARIDPEFRRQLLAQNLERLLEALNSMRKTSNSEPNSARHLREGADLALRLADRLQQNDPNSDTQAA